MPAASPTIERFSKKYRVDSKTGCWCWIGAVSRGYGYIQDERKPALAHRFAYRHFIGDFPDEAQILHRCDNAICVNPDHLKVGDHAENMNDLVKSGRAIGRPKAGAVKGYSVRKIFALLRAGHTQKEIAETLGVARSTIQRAIYGNRDFYGAHKRYLSEEAKTQLRNMLEAGVPVLQIAKALKIDRKTVRNWRSKLEGT